MLSEPLDIMDHLPEWASMYFRNVEDLVTDDFWDSSTFRAQPDTNRYLHQIVVKAPADGFKPSALWGGETPIPVPTWFFITQDQKHFILGWLLEHPVVTKADKPHAENTFLQVQEALMKAHGATERVNHSDQIPVPWAQELSGWYGKSYTLSGMKDQIKAAGFYKNIMPVEFLSRGGSVTSEAKKEAAKANIIKAHKELQKKALERAIALVSYADSGATKEQIAEKFDFSLHSVDSTLSRARKRIAEANS